jgi:TPP-dependent pyruvate/acetoin dehydrogenase alpha subunit
MARMRVMEERVEAMYTGNQIKGPVHVAVGMEAIAAAFSYAMEPDDYLLCTYRGHIHALGRGISMRAIIAEMLGKRDGVLRGKGGSMHLASAAHRFFGSNAIVGAQMLIALGPAWASQIRNERAVTVCFFGDGAANIGAFHEALNLAAVWSLPIVFVCENNLYMEYTLTAEVTAVEHPAADRAAAYGLSREVVDGNDVEVMHAAAADALQRCRDGSGPVLLEAMTYRMRGHSSADPAKYRDASEVAAWGERDPIRAARRAIEALGGHGSALDDIDAAAIAETLDAVEQATAAAEPHPEDLLTDVWADGGSSWRR